jgi:antitoxin MazE
MKAKLVQIGNSRGIRLPKPLIEEARLNDEVDIHVQDGAIVITSTSSPRMGWATSAKKLHDQKQDAVFDSYSPTNFDMKEWKW